MRSHRVTEQGFVVAPFQTVLTRLLLVSPACGQILQALDVIVDDRTVADYRPDHFVVAARQSLDQLADFFPAHNCRRSLSHSIHSPTPSSVVHETRKTGKVGCTRRAYSSALSSSVGKYGTRSVLFNTMASAFRNIAGYLRGLSSPSVMLMTITRKCSPSP